MNVLELMAMAMTRYARESAVAEFVGGQES
jgi:hypothetical protein